MCVQFCINAWNAVVPLCLSTCVRLPDFRNLFLNATNQEIDRQIDKGGECGKGGGGELRVRVNHHHHEKTCLSSAGSLRVVGLIQRQPAPINSTLSVSQ